MTILPVNNFDYTARDFEAIRARLFALIQTYFVDADGRPIWTDTQAKSFGNLLVELFSHVGDNISFYRDEYTLEQFLPTVQHRENMIRLLRLIAYELSSPSPATVDLKFSIPAVMAGDVAIALRDQVRSSADPNIIYEVTTAGSITAGTTEVTLPAEHAVTVTESALSTSLPNQRHLMSGTPYIDNSMSLTDDIGAWTEVENFLSSRPTDRHFRTEIDSFDRVTVVFGDGSTGAIPTGTINFEYLKGGGTAGQVEAGVLTRLTRSYSDSFGTPASVSVVNELASSGGVDRESMEQARILAPLDLRSLNRTISREDFETNAKRVANVSRALMLTKNEIVGIGENTGQLYIVSYGTQLASGRYAPATPSATDLADVLTEIEVTRPHTVTFTPVVLAAPFVDVDIDAIVYVAEGYTAARVRDNIDAALADFFAAALEDKTDNEEIQFGWYYKNVAGDFSGELAWSDVFNVIRDTEGVRKISSATDGMLLNGTRAGVYLEAQQFPRLGAVGLIDGDTGSAI